MSSGTVDLAFACSWWRPKPPTWSYIPASLRQGLVETGTRIHDIEAQPPLLIQGALAAALTLAGHKPWKYSRLYRAVEERRVLRAVKRIQPRAVLGFANVVVPASAPTFVYQDMNFSVAVDQHQLLGREMNSAISTDLAQLRRLAEEQRLALGKLAGVFTMGRWYRDYLIQHQGLPANRIHAVGGGISHWYANSPLRDVRAKQDRTRLLFVGGEFFRKGGDLVLEAVRRLNSGGDRRLSLTIVGPPTWPLGSPPPPWVDFRGRLSQAETAKLFMTHDLFVMPSRFEAYGLVFLEARSVGTPCVGRNAYAMPELIEASGKLWGTDDVNDLADLCLSALNDDQLHETCMRNAKKIASDNTWTRVAERVMGHISVSKEVE